MPFEKQVDDMKEFLSSQLFSVIIGACLTLITSVIVGKKTYSNALDEKLAEERISAYKVIYKIISQLNHSLSPKNAPSIPNECYLGYINTSENEYHLAYCFPTIFLSFTVFHEYKCKLSMTLNEKRIFLTQPVLNKLSYLDSYLSEIWHRANGKSDDYLQMMGFIFMNEIDSICRTIEDDIQDFFINGKKKMRRSDFNSTYKYEEEQRKKSELFTLYKESKNIEPFGDLPLCSNCGYNKNCPLNNISNKPFGDSIDNVNTSTSEISI